MYTVILIIFIALAVVGAKRTWNIVKKLADFFGIGVNDFEGLLFMVVIFLLVFLVLSPVMGVVEIVKKIG